jgi:hypothetical protein
MTTSQQLKHMIETLNPKSYVRWIQRREHLRSFLEQQQQTLKTRSAIETLYCWHYEITPPQCGCGQTALFNSFVKGYRQFCSQNCPQKAQKHSSVVKAQWQDADKLQRMLEKRNQTNLERYGHTNPALNSTVKEKIRNTVQEKYGASTPLESPMVVEKIRQKNLETLGVEFPFQSSKVQDQSKQTFLKNHGEPNRMQIARAAWAQQHHGQNPFEVASVRQRAFDTMLEKYGAPYAFQVPELYQKHADTHFLRWGRANAAQMHLSDEQFQLLSDPVKLSAALQSHTVSDLATSTGIRKSLLMRYHDRYQLGVIPHKSRSSFEDEIAAFLDRHQIAYSKNNKKLIAPLELDFVIGNRWAIEFNGLYWHSELGGSKNPQYHQYKMRQCEERGIQLITIWEDEWIEKTPLCQSVILSHVGSNNKIAGRKCTIQEVQANEMAAFLKTHHLQGHSNASVNLVLEQGGEILSAMTFARPRYNKNIQWELLRAASAMNCTVQGGASRLWNHFVKTRNPENVVSYCDRRWFTGRIYQQLGFEKTVSGRPTYWYTDYQRRYHRSGFTKKQLVLEGADKTCTEWQIMQSRGWDRVWDCGQDTWIWRK